MARAVARALALATLAAAFLLGGMAYPRGRSWTSQLDGTAMLLIPAGDFIMGSAAGRGEADERPACRVHVDAFFLAREPVTNAQYARFLNLGTAGGLQVEHCLALRGRSPRPSEIRWQEGAYVVTPGYGDHPVIGVSWDGAQEYCRWAGLRLPTEAEWEYAAHGGRPDGAYPWGDEAPSARRAAYGRAWTSGARPAPTTAVRSFPPNGFGLFDMVGNAAQWTQSVYAAYPYRATDGRQAPHVLHVKRVQRGGGWHAKPWQLRVRYRQGAFVDTLGSYNRATGFRCAANGL